MISLESDFSNESHLRNLSKSKGLDGWILVEPRKSNQNLDLEYYQGGGRRGERRETR